MKSKSTGREERLAAALRENLKRRKQRSRALGNEAANDVSQAKDHAEETPRSGPNPAAKNS